MGLRQIEYFLAVADHGNFTRAAKSLHVSQPALSQQVKHLERTLGAVLFDRSGRSVRLTTAGEVYAYHARLALRDLSAGERAVHDVRDLSRGQLRVGATPTFTAYLIGPLVHRFHTEYPGIQLTVVEPNQDRIENDLLSDCLDLGIGFAGEHAPGIVHRTLFTETMSLVVSSSHRFAATTGSLPVAELADEPLAMLSANFATSAHVRAYLASQDVRQRIAVETDSVMSLLALIKCGSLVSVLPDVVVGQDAGLRCIPLTPAPPGRSVQLMWRGGVYPSAAMRAFVDIVWDAASALRTRP